MTPRLVLEVDGLRQERIEAHGRAVDLLVRQVAGYQRLHELLRLLGGGRGGPADLLHALRWSVAVRPGEAAPHGPTGEG